MQGMPVTAISYKSMNYNHKPPKAFILQKTPIYSLLFPIVNTYYPSTYRKNAFGNTLVQ